MNPILSLRQRISFHHIRETPTSQKHVPLRTSQGILHGHASLFESRIGFAQDVEHKFICGRLAIGNIERIFGVAHGTFEIIFTRKVGRGTAEDGVVELIEFDLRRVVAFSGVFEIGFVPFCLLQRRSQLVMGLSGRTFSLPGFEELLFLLFLTGRELFLAFGAARLVEVAFEAAVSVFEVILRYRISQSLSVSARTGTCILTFRSSSVIVCNLRSSLAVVAI